MTTATEYAGLIRDICEHPGDDAPRLILADWLEDNGDSDRSLFIRTQVGIASGALFPTDVIRHREQILLNSGKPTNSWVWAGLPLGYLATKSDARTRAKYTFRRGFVEKISLTLADFMEHAETLFRQHPIEQVTLSDRKLLASPDGPGGWYYVSEQLDRSHFIPLEIAACFHKKHIGRVLGWVTYQSATDAQAALSVACVRYGRHLAGLPEIPLP